MIAREPISERVCLLATYIIQDFISEWGQEGVMHTSIIQLSEIHTYPYFFLLVLFLNHYRAYPIILFYWFNNHCHKHLIQLSVNTFLILRVKVVRSLFYRLHIQFQGDLYDSQVSYYPF